MTFVCAEDTVVVHSMDRLARNLDDLRQIMQTLTRRKIGIEFVKEHFAFTGEDSPMANLMPSVMGTFAEFERALIRERQREGIAIAKQRGAYRGPWCELGRVISILRRACGAGLHLGERR
jgi:DNA invertase Pin-like site-specific DNA recombinase